MKKFILILFAIAFYCYKSPFFHAVDPPSFSVVVPDKLDGPLTPNTGLDSFEKLHDGLLQAPEAFAVYNDKIYTGLNDGRIVQVTQDKIIDVAHLGEPCAGLHETHICGRPLGMVFSKTGRLYVVDPHHGLFAVDIKTGKKKLILSSKTVVDGAPLTFLNNLALDEKEQAFYLTQSSSKWNMSDVFVSILEHDTSGRMLKYDFKTKKTSVLLKGLSLPNGIELTEDGSALLVATGSNGNKIFKYFIHGEKKGSHIELPLVLPGEPDNISRTKRGTFWIAFLSCHSQENPNPMQKLADKPLVRKVIIFANKIITTPIATIMNLLPYDWIKELAYKIQTGLILVDYFPKYGLVIEFDANGKILRSLHSPKGDIGFLSEALEHNGYLYLGSWKNNFIGRVRL